MWSILCGSHFSSKRLKIVWLKHQSSSSKILVNSSAGFPSEGTQKTSLIQISYLSTRVHNLLSKFFCHKSLLLFKIVLIAPRLSICSSIHELCSSFAKE